MATVNEAKDRILERLATMDMDKMTLMDAGMYVDILKKITEIGEKSYADILQETLEATRKNFAPCNEPVRLGMGLGGVK